MDFKGITGIVGGMGGLIALYLVLIHSSDFSSITNGIASGGGSLVKTLQGR